jgi:hypothetical protein
MMTALNPLLYRNGSSIEPCQGFEALIKDLRLRGKGGDGEAKRGEDASGKSKNLQAFIQVRGFCSRMG